MPPTAPRGKPAGRAAVNTRANNDKQEESIYNIGALQPPTAPKVRTYHVSPPSPTGGPRVRMHADSSQVSAALNPVHGVRDAQLRQGIKPADHAKSNRDAVREVSQFNALRKAAVAEQEQILGSKPATLPRSTSYPQRRSTPPAAGNSRQSGDGSQGGRDFVSENRLGAAAAPTRQPLPKPLGDDGVAYLQKRDYGRVPSYLLARKMELAETAAQAQRDKEAALIPPGMRLLPEDERLETLALLARNRQEVERALQSLPIIIETPSAIRKKNDLEQRLREIEDATKVFSRPKVLVAAS